MNHRVYDVVDDVATVAYNNTMDYAHSVAKIIFFLFLVLLIEIVENVVRCAFLYHAFSVFKRHDVHLRVTIVRTYLYELPVTWRDKTLTCSL